MDDLDSALSRLSAGLARDEAIARAADAADRPGVNTWDGLESNMFEQTQRHSPDRVLNRYIPAIRKVLSVCDAIDAEALAGAWWEGKYGDWADDIREALAGIYEPTEEKP